MKEVPDKLLPLIVHLEYKVMRDQDEQNSVNISPRLEVVRSVLTKGGYTFQDEVKYYIAN